MRTVLPKTRSRRVRRPPRVHRVAPPGSMPGTLKAPANAAPVEVQVIQYTSDEFAEVELDNPSDLSGVLATSGVTWINVNGLADVEVIRAVGQAFGLHHLALEDVLNIHQQAKVDYYDDHLFIVLRMLSKSDCLRNEQISVFLSERLVLTIQERRGDCLDPVRNRLRAARGRIRNCDSSYLAYAIVDAVVDAYFPIVEEYAERIDLMEEHIIGGQTEKVIDEVHELRGDLMSLRRAVRPLRDALLLLMPDAHSLISKETEFYLRDCFDHTAQLIDLVDSYREICAELREYHMSVASQRMNEVMKVLTVIATVFMPLSFIAGLYGMNFNTGLPGNMPELNMPYGYVLTLTVMVLCAATMVYAFWTRGWLRRADGVKSGRNS